MEALLILLSSLLSLAFAELQISSSLQNHYLHQQDIEIDLFLHNSGDAPVTLPDLDVQTWRVQFLLDGPNGTQKINSVKTDQAEVWTLQPRQGKLLRFSVPNSKALPLGKYSFTLLLDLPTPYEEQKEFHIVKPKVSCSDLETVSIDGFFPQDEYLWCQSLPDDQRSLYLSRARNHHLSTLPSTVAPQQSISKGRDRHVYWLYNNQLTAHQLSAERLDSRQIILSSPWPNVELLTRGVTGAKNLHLPLWVPSPNTNQSGSVQMVAADYKGPPTFRKITSLPSKPIQSDSAITEQQTPLLLINHPKGVYLYTLTEVGDPKIDSLPPKSARLMVPTEQEQIVDARFGVHNEHGLIIHILFKRNDEYYSHLFNHTGRAIAIPQKIALPTDVTISQVRFQGQSATVLGKRNQRWGLWMDEQWTDLSVQPRTTDLHLSLSSKRPMAFFVADGQIERISIP